MRKKALSMVLALCMLLSISAFLTAQNSGVTIISYAYTSHTKSEAISWVKSKLGKSLDYDGVYGAQCVDLIMYYYKYLGVNPAMGNAADYTWNTLPSGWKRLKGAQPQTGDILIYTGGYGHVAIYESDKCHYHQNFNSHMYVEKVTYVYNDFGNDYWGVIRPDFKAEAKPTYTWSSDGKSCTARLEKSASQVITEKATVTSKQKTAPTCTQKGITTYTAAFKNTSFTTQTKDIRDIPVAAHKYGSWTVTTKASSGVNGTMKRTCKVCEAAETSKYVYYSRISGSTRYATAVGISKASFTKANTVILASGTRYADALAGVPLAKELNAPILLTEKEKLPSEVLSEIKRLGAADVIILGGVGAIGNEVAEELEKNDLNVERIAGKTRFSTAAAIAEKLAAEPTEVFFVYGMNYADALSVSTVAAIKKAPIVYLTTKGELNPDTAAYLAKIKNKVKNAYVIGGKGVISDDMMSKAAKALGLQKATRIAGKDRYSTCVAVNDAFKNVLTGKMICVATGTNFPDALAGGVYAAAKKSPIMLVNGKTSSLTLTDTQKSFLKGRTINAITVLGGRGAIPSAHVLTVSIASVK